MITSEAPRRITYRDGNTGMAWTGIGLEHNKPWSSQAPRVIAYMDEPLVRHLEALGAKSLDG